MMPFTEQHTLRLWRSLRPMAAAPCISPGCPTTPSRLPSSKLGMIAGSLPDWHTHTERECRLWGASAHDLVDLLVRRCLTFGEASPRSAINATTLSTAARVAIASLARPEPH
jgi:hypothetical protein